MNHIKIKYKKIRKNIKITIINKTNNNNNKNNNT